MSLSRRTAMCFGMLAGSISESRSTELVAAQSAARARVSKIAAVCCAVAGLVVFIGCTNSSDSAGMDARACEEYTDVILGTPAANSSMNTEQAIYEIVQRGASATPCVVRLLREADKRELDYDLGYLIAYLDSDAKQSLFDALAEDPVSPKRLVAVIQAVTVARASLGYPLDRARESTVGFMVEQLAHPDLAVREAAVTALDVFVKPGDKQVVRSLIDVRDTLSARGQIGLAGALASAGSEGFPTLVDMLDHSDDWLAITVVRSIGRLAVSDDRALATLIKLLDDPRQTVAETAANQLGDHSAAAIPALLRRISSGDNSFLGVSAAVRALGRSGTQEEEVLRALAEMVESMDTSASTGLDAANALGRLSPAGLPYLLEALRSPSAEIRARSLNGLTMAGISARVALPLIRAEFGAGRAETTCPAALALWRMGHLARRALTVLRACEDPYLYEVAIPGSCEEAVPDLVHWLGEPDLRYIAVRALGELGDTAVTYLLPATSDLDPAIREAAIDGLRRVGVASRDVREAFVAAMGDPAPKVRASAALAYGETAGADPQETMAVLTKVLAAEQAAEARVGILGALVSVSCRTGIALDGLLEAALEDDDRFVRQSVLSQLIGLAHRADCIHTDAARKLQEPLK